MGVKEKTKQHFQNSGKLERRRHRTIDWLGLAIFASAAFVGAVFVFGSISNLMHEEAFFAEIHNDATFSLEYNWNVEHNGSTPEKTYEEARQALFANDLGGVLATIHPAYLSKYEPGLRKATEEGILYKAAERLTPLLDRVYDGGGDIVVIYEIAQIPNNDDPNPLNNFSRRVEFTRDSKAVWKISSI